MEKTAKDYGIISPQGLNPNYQKDDPRKQKDGAYPNYIDYGAIDDFFENMQKGNKFDYNASAFDMSGGALDMGSASISRPAFAPMNSLRERRYERGLSRLERQMAKAERMGDYDRVEALGSEMESLDPASFSDEVSQGAQMATRGGLAALTEVPKIIATYQGDPASDKEATGRVLQTMASGASIGTAIMPGIGTAIGAGAGLIGGLIGTAGKVKKYQREMLAKNNARVEDQLSEDELNRARFYRMENDSRALESKRNLIAQSMGYYV